MGFSYLNGKNWSEITREERFFCAVLFEQFKSTPLKFVHWLNEQTKINLDTNCEWELGYEVCFYRDLLKSQAESVKKSEYPQKRTFDLCLFSEKSIVIIEAKCQQGFKLNQVKSFERDIEDIPKITPSNIEVKLVGLASSLYYTNLKKFGKTEVLKPFNECLISWEALYNTFKNPIYLQANKLYKN